MKLNDIRVVCDLRDAGLEPEEIRSVVRLARQYRRCCELMCGTNNWVLEQDELAGRWIMVSMDSDHPMRVPAKPSLNPDRIEQKLRDIAWRRNMELSFGRDPRGAVVNLVKDGKQIYL